MTTRGAAASWRSRLGSRWRAPLYRNGYALVVNTGLTGGLGLLYWLVAARSYSTAAVGIGAALISAMTLIGNLAHLNLKGALNRFLPIAGADSARFTALAYAIAMGVGGAAGIVFLAGLDLWSPALEVLHRRPGLALLFVLGAMGWTVFVLQDSVLTGIRRATWVPVENLAFSVAKIVVLLALAASMPVLGVFVSWIVPVLIMIVPLTAVIFWRLIPAHARDTRMLAEPIEARVVARYVAADYLAYLISAVTQGVVPLVVLNVLGPEESAYYFLAWTISYALYLVSSSMGSAMMTEASMDPGRLATFQRQAARESARIVIPAALLVVAFAPALLGAVGEDYAEFGTTPLRLLALSAMPFIVVATFIKVRSVQKRMRSVVATEAAVAGLVLVAGASLIGPLGTTGIALAWLVAQSAVAVAILGVQLAEPGGPGRRGALVRLASLAALTLRNARARPGARRAVRAALAMVARDHPAAASWSVTRHLSTLNDVTVATVGTPGAEAVAIVKCARTARQDAALIRAARIQRVLHGRTDLTAWASARVPVVLARGSAEGRECVVETLVGGATCEGAARGDRAAAMLEAAAAAIAPLHDATARPTSVDAARIRRWVDAPIATLLPVVRRRSRRPDAEAALRRLAEELTLGLRGRVVVTSWVHGDLAPGNLLARERGGISGIIDWENARSWELPHVDLLHLLFTIRSLREGRELGAVFAEWLRLPEWQPAERSVVRRLDALGTDADMRTLVILTWLRHVSSNVAKSARYGRSRLWVAGNIDPVLGAVARDA